jgi:hypothetical protein
VVAARLGGRWDVASKQDTCVTRALEDEKIDLSSARIVLLGRVRVPPQTKVLWLEQDGAAAPIWEPPPPRLVVLTARGSEVGQGLVSVLTCVDVTQQDS